MDTKLIMEVYSNDPDFSHGKSIYTVVFLNEDRVRVLLSRMKLFQAIHGSDEELVEMKYMDYWAQFFEAFPYPEVKEYMVGDKLFVRGETKYGGGCFLPTASPSVLIKGQTVQWLADVMNTDVGIWSVSVTKDSLEYHLAEVLNKSWTVKSSPFQRIKSIIFQKGKNIRVQKEEGP